MIALASIFIVSLVLTASLFGNVKTRFWVTLVAGGAAVVVAWLLPTPASVLAGAGGGILVGSSLVQRPSTLSDCLGTALIAVGAVFGEVASGTVTLEPLPFMAMVLAGFGAGWILESWQASRARRAVVTTMGSFVVVSLSMIAVYGVDASMLELPVSGLNGEPALLVARGEMEVEAFRWLVPVPNSLVAIATFAALLPVGGYLLWRSKVTSNPKRSLWRQVAPFAFAGVFGAGLLAMTFLILGRAPEVLRLTPDAETLEIFRPSSVASQWEMLLRPLEESYRIDRFALIPFMVSGFASLALAFTSGLRVHDEDEWVSGVSLWPAVIAFSLSAMLFAAFRVDIAMGTWSGVATSTTMLIAALMAAGIELQVNLGRNIRNGLAAALVFAVSFVWIVEWSSLR
jgi:hypothetical protein